MFTGTIKIKCNNRRTHMTTEGLNPLECVLILKSAIEQIQDSPEYQKEINDFHKYLLMKKNNVTDCKMEDNSWN